MSLKHLVFIVNPRSGVERKKEIAEAIDQCLDKEVYSFEIQLTEYAQHGEVLARTAAEAGAFAVVAVGGDGSVNDALRGLYGTDTLFAIIPKGSGNGMARTLGIPLDVAKAIQLINRCKTEKIDVCFANDKLFISNAGVGFDALISKKFSKSKRRGLMVYSWLVTKYLWLYKEWTWQIKVDDESIIEQKAFLVNVANGQQFGYDFKIAPTASYTDGMLDLVIIKKFPKILGGLLSLRLMNGKILQSKYVEHFRGKKITISSPGLKLMQTDGDAIICSNEIHFRIEENRQRIIVG
jgi:diacylglycerol kinase (ATP)